MHFNGHLDLIGQHAFLSASKYHWVNYSEDKLRDSYKKVLAAQKGSEIHDFARSAIKLGFSLPKNGSTVSSYVNDAIGYKMVTEQILFYSYNAFGTADAICFRRNFLRIHDLKTGTSPAYMIQLKIYAALFCLEYNVDPNKINIELRLYQSNEIEICKPEGSEIAQLMEHIVACDKIINNLKLQEEE